MPKYERPEFVWITVHFHGYEDFTKLEGIYNNGARLTVINTWNV